MARYKVLCGKRDEKGFVPNNKFTGYLNGLHFKEGVAETDDAKLAKYVAGDLGYQIVETEDKKADEGKDKK